MILTLKSLWPLFTMFLTSSVGGSVKKLSVAQFRISNASPINNTKIWKNHVFKILNLLKKSLVWHFHETYLGHNYICYIVQTLLRIKMSHTSCCLFYFALDFWLTQDQQNYSCFYLLYLYPYGMCLFLTSRFDVCSCDINVYIYKGLKTNNKFINDFYYAWFMLHWIVQILESGLQKTLNNMIETIVWSWYTNNHVITFIFK